MIKKLTLKKSKIIFYYKKFKKLNYLHIKITNPFPKLQKLKYFSVSDGKYKFKVIKIEKNFVIAKSEISFVLGKQKE